MAKALRQNDLYRFVTYDAQPSLNTFNTLRRRLGTKGFIEIHKRFVAKAHGLGLLEPEIKELPKNRKKGIILVADSTFLITSGSTKGHKEYRMSHMAVYLWTSRKPRAQASRASLAKSGNAETAKPTPKVKRAAILSRPPKDYCALCERIDIYCLTGFASSKYYKNVNLNFGDFINRRITKRW